MKRTLKDEDTESYFGFDSDKWDHVGDDGTGPLGHFLTQGDRKLYASPRRTKTGRHRFVLLGSGYYPSGTGSGWKWEKNVAQWVSFERGLEMMDDVYRAEYLEKSFSPEWYESAEVENTIPRRDRRTENLLTEFPQLVRLRYYRGSDGETRKTVEIEI